MLKYAKRITPVPIKQIARRVAEMFEWDPWQQKSWSQEGEDQILRRIFERKSSGFYVDVGAHHPKRFSNTYLFYKRGWRGVNIDAMPGSMMEFQKSRPRDINFECGVGLTRGEIEFFIFDEPALNGFSKEISLLREKSAVPQKIVDRKMIKVLPLAEILDQLLPKGQSIDFMTVDVEGLDFDVLSSNDWGKYRPEYVLAEILNSSLDEVEGSNVGVLMENNGYKIYAKCMNTVFFKRI
jgi:FkbM family methyltransferase